MTERQAKRNTIDSMVRYYAKFWINGRILFLYRQVSDITYYWHFGKLSWIVSKSTRLDPRRPSPSMRQLTEQEVHEIQRERATRLRDHIDAWLLANP